MFQHTATRRWLQGTALYRLRCSMVSTHSHPKVAALRPICRACNVMSFNTQPPEGGCNGYKTKYKNEFVSTHSHPKVAAVVSGCQFKSSHSFNTQPPEGGCYNQAADTKAMFLFQHTATRRWLPCVNTNRKFIGIVSTHSHPKVAARIEEQNKLLLESFNTQPPEGGCPNHNKTSSGYRGVSTHSHPKVAAAEVVDKARTGFVSTHSHPKVAA